MTHLPNLIMNTCHYIERHIVCISYMEEVRELVNEFYFILFKKGKTRKQMNKQVTPYHGSLFF